MKTKHLSLFLGLVVAIIAIVAILFGFANAFADSSDLADTRGNLFAIMFGQGTETGYQSVPLLIAGFVFLLVSAVIALLVALIPLRLVKMVGFGLVTILMLAAGIFAFFTSSAWLSANNGLAYAVHGEVANGVGPIGMGISSLVGAFLAAYSVSLARKL